MDTPIPSVPRLSLSLYLHSEEACLPRYREFQPSERVSLVLTLDSGPYVYL